MASNTRQSPLGMSAELEPDDKDKEHVIQFYLEAYQPYIEHCIGDYRELLMGFPLFSPEQRKKFNKIGKSRPESAVSEMLEAIFEMKDEPNRYSVLVESLEDNEKVVDILTGRKYPQHQEHQKLIHIKGNTICKMLKTSDILPSLVSKGVIAANDMTVISNKELRESAWHANIDLLDLLPEKKTKWFKLFMEALVENDYEGLAKELDEKLSNSIKNNEDTDSYMPSVCPDGIYTGDSPEDSPEVHKRVLNRRLPKIVTDLDPISILDKIAEKELLPSNDIRDIRELPSTTTKNRAIVEKISRKGSETYNRFKDCLRETSQEHLVEALEGEECLLSLKEGDQLQSTDDPPSREPTMRGELSNEADYSVRENYLSHESEPSLNNLSPAKPDSIPSEISITMPSGRANQNLSLDFGNLVLDKDNTTVKGKEVAAKSQPDVSLDQFSASFNSLNQASMVSNDTNESLATDIDPDQTRVKTVDCVNTPRRVVEGAEKGFKEKIVRENSQSPTMKEMKDKMVLDERHVDNTASVESLNISKAEPMPSIEVEPEVDVPDTDISLREYQVELAAPAMEGKNVIIVAPTGSGKTRVAFSIIQDHIRKKQGRGIAKVIFLVNQVALANQQGDECLKLLPRYKSKVISGESQRARSEFLKDFIDKRDILIVTAQVLLDALIRKEIPSICQFSLMVFDECHHTNSNHTFNQIMGLYMDKKFGTSKSKTSTDDVPQIVGLTASVGVGKARSMDKAVEHIKGLMANLDAQVIATVQSNMQELRNFVSLPDEETCTVPKRENDVFGNQITKLMNTIEERMGQAAVVKEMVGAKAFESALKSPAEKGSPQYTQWASKLWKEVAKLRDPTARRFLNPCRTHLDYYNNALIIYNDARVEDALNYLKVEMKRWKDNAILDENEVALDNAFEKIKSVNWKVNGSTNPKLDKLQTMILKAYQGVDGDNSRGIVFVKTRDLAYAIVSWMKETPGLRELNPIPFVGQQQSSDKGDRGSKMTKAEQDDALVYFKQGKHKLIVATSVAEEGLDISKCNLVIRYDHVTNEIAMVQSRGRGRAKDSKYYVLATQGTGMAEKEELNMIREVMMRKAIIQLQAYIRESPKKFLDDVYHLQDGANLERQLKSLGGRRKLVKAGDFELKCIKCSYFICMSSDVKRIQGAHHVVIDESLGERVNFVKGGSPRFADETIQFSGKLICRECGDSLGVICIYKKMEFPVLTIQKILIVDINERQTTCKQWKQVPFHVSQLGTDDFREILENRSGDL